MKDKIYVIETTAARGTILLATEEFNDFVRQNNPVEYIRKDTMPEWSEEDEKMMSDIIGVFDGRVSIYTLPVKQYANRLKSLSLRTNWKPSEEQMQGLCEGILKADKGSAAENAMVSLYNDLKKLM